MVGKQARESSRLYQEARVAALQLVHDSGYAHCRTWSETSLAEDGELVHYFRIEARNEPNATRTTPADHLIVRVRFAGPAHKTLRASFVTTPPDALRHWLPS